MLIETVKVNRFSSESNLYSFKMLLQGHVERSSSWGWGMGGRESEGEGHDPHYIGTIQTPSLLRRHL